MKKPPKPSSDVRKWLPWVVLVAALVVFAWHASSSAFLQDDSYITYRYARNVIRGNGPVFNPGERTEGYTNFLWMMMLAVLGIVGLPFSTIIPLSQVIGVLCGAVTMFLFFLIIRRHTRGPPELASFAVLLLAANGSFAYWCVSGMETALFTTLLVAAFWFYTRDDSRRSLVTASALLGISALTRPEGAMFMAIFALDYFIRAMVRREFFTARHLRRFGLFILPFLLLVVPLYTWRLSYYGYLFPNTFYAKTGASTAYFKAGIEYLVNFHKAYGLWGIALVGAVILLAVRKRIRASRPLSLALLALVFHALYVIWVGGDVLRIHRFFVPVLVFFYLLVSEGIWHLPLPRAVNFLVLLALLPLTFIGPFIKPRTVRQDIQRNLMLENGLVSKMSATGRWLNENLDGDDWFSCTTIGAVSWHADRNMVDMLGLTDAYIAHNPENILPVKWHWKERNYNTKYLLEKKPVYVYFSTGIKPSAEAERALFLRPRFRRGYFACPVTIMYEGGYGSDVLYKRRPGADTIPLEPLPEHPEFINHYLDGINALRRDRDSAFKAFRSCIRDAPPDFGYAHEWLGQLFQSTNQTEQAVASFREAVRRNDWCITSHVSLAAHYSETGNDSLAFHHVSRVVDHAPDYINGYTNLAIIAVQTGNWEAGERALLAALDKWPGVPELHLRLAYLYFEAGQLDRAEQILDAYLRASLGDRNARQMLDEIRRRRSETPQ